MAGFAARAIFFCFSSLSLRFSECRATVEVGADKQEEKDERDGSEESRGSWGVQFALYLALPGHVNESRGFLSFGCREASYKQGSNFLCFTCTWVLLAVFCISVRFASCFERGSD